MTSKSGISLLEVIIAVFIVVIAAIAATAIITSSFQINRISKNKMIAANLAREGIEGVRNIRDSNWLRYSSIRDECWNFMENPEAATPVYSCTSGNKIGHQKYYALQFGRYDQKNSTIPYTYKWYLSEITELTLIYPLENISKSELDTSPYKLKLRDLLRGNDGNGDGNTMNDIDESVFAATSSGISDQDSIPTTFYRQIYVEYIDTDGNGTPDANDSGMKVTSRVVWFEKGNPKTIKLVSQITNYLESNE
ncbi:hypothetical protein HYV57_00200 [Candidatus Peregrinibacteria bacterium]|nr:hypothetical protein [Candidatus Peregrinibacteria bacterium]